MKKTILGKIALFVLVMSGGVAQASSSHSGLTLGSFRLAQVSAFQKDGNLFSGFLGWTPAFWVNQSFGVRLSVGGILAKSKIGDKYLIMDAEALAVFEMSGNLVLEAGGGIQNFSGNGGTRTALTGNLVYQTNILFFDHVYFGYTAALVPTNLTHELRFGVGMGF